MKKTVVVIVGPTAVGKTKLSIEMAKRFSGEIISGDSMQVYKGMDIGTAKIHDRDMQGIPHYMIDIKEPDENFSVADFQSYVQSYIEDITARDHLPIIVGGSGLYIQAALYDYNFAEQKRDPNYTYALEQRIEQEGIMPVYEELKKIDPEQADKIHPNNHRRVIRALEIYETTGQTMTEHHRTQQQKESIYHPVFIGLEMERQLLYKRINQRVDEMIKQGLIEEVKSLYNRGYRNCQSMKAIGYKEFIPYFEGNLTLEECIVQLKRNSRRYAKRQYTWFKNQLHIQWYSVHPKAIHVTFEKILTDFAGIV